MPHESDESAEAAGEAIIEQREAQLLLQLGRAQHSDGGELVARRLTAELLAPYWNYSLRIVRWKLHGLAVPEADIEDVAADVLERMVRALANTTEFTKPLKYVVLDNIGWACGDFRRQRRRRRRESLRAPDELGPPTSAAGRMRSTLSGSREPIGSGDGEGPDGEGLAAQARTFGGRVATLHGRDREIVTRRFFAAVSPADIARELGMSRGALDTATHRALRKVLASEALADVRNTRARPEGEAG
jgi:DNA-directed RNA polymerase specialized sigma24 family protein